MTASSVSRTVTYGSSCSTTPGLGRTARPPAYFAASLAAIPATWRPWARAMANSLALGCRSPFGPAMVVGEPEGIHIVLGNDRIARPIAEHGADLVLHGHAHVGSFEGRIGEIPVYNVALHVIGRDFWLFDVEGSPRPQATRQS